MGPSLDSWEREDQEHSKCIMKHETAVVVIPIERKVRKIKYRDDRHTEQIE